MEHRNPQTWNTLIQMYYFQLPDAPLYAAVGRCFVFKTREAIDTGMAEQQKQLKEQIEKTKTQKEALEKKEKETKETVEELMKNKQSK